MGLQFFRYDKSLSDFGKRVIMPCFCDIDRDPVSIELGPFYTKSCPSRS